ncbi:MAG TPA: UDP-2,3-diacylglucosamine diphosphatase [Gammaproteobacteria bacterium]|nr:UDP-2,3-diacylglucosamine diphosphatase [Gammaproteobacteria bacterium]
MSTLFIADLHLSTERPEIIALFLRFLEQEATQAEALYILGDLFEAWLGDDAVQPELQEVLTGLKKLTESGVPVFVMVGNRDFLLGETFEKMTGCTLLDDPSVVDLYGTPTLLMHGDTLCTDDVDYQAFRQQVRTPQWRKAVLAKSIAERLQMAREARAQSQAHTREKSAEIMDVNAQAVEDAFRQHGVRRLIHGHTHRPAVHELSVDGKNTTRIVLGDWYQQTSVLKVTADDFSLTPAGQ